MVDKYRDYIEIISKETGFIPSTLEKVERLIRILEWMNYVDNKESVFTNIFSTLLNNFGVVSYEYGVIKKYNVNIKFNFSNYKII